MDLFIFELGICNINLTMTFVFIQADWKIKFPLVGNADILTFVEMRS